jgi:hypothetical protein
MEDVGITVQWFGVPCACRCRHCLLRSSSRLSGVPREDARGIVDRFVSWREECGRPGFAVDFTVGYCLDYPEVFDDTRWRCRMGCPGARYLPLNGLRMRSREQLVSFLTRLREAGIAEVALTFHGSGDAHDAFVGRPGDYALMLGAARAAGECGLARSETLYLARGGAAGLAAVCEDLALLPPPVRRSVVPWDFRGRGEGLEDCRATSADFAVLPSELAECVNREAYRPEREWIPLIESRQVPPKRRRHYFVSVWADSLAYLRSASCDEIIAGLRSREESLVQQMPSMADLARSYGDVCGERLYALRDLEWKWQGRYVAGHPELGVAARYDELEAGVWCK